MVTCGLVFQERSDPGGGDPGRQCDGVGLGQVYGRVPALPRAHRDDQRRKAEPPLEDALPEPPADYSPVLDHGVPPAERSGPYRHMATVRALPDLALPPLPPPHPDPPPPP